MRSRSTICGASARAAARAAASREPGPLDELTKREREVLGLMAEGRSNAAIGQALFLSPKTVEANVGRIFRKLGLQQSQDDHRRVLAVLEYLRAGSATH